MPRITKNPQTLPIICLILLILFNPLVIIPAGERGVLLKFGAVQEQVLVEGLQAIIPLINSVKKISVRIQKQEISAEASSKDLQEVFTDIALNWHIIPEQVNTVFQEIGQEEEVVDKIINPSVEEALKAIMAKYTAEEIITRREEVKAAVDNLLSSRLAVYHLKIDDVSLVHVHFSQRFTDAVEAKQIAEQEAKKAGFAVLKARREAEIKINKARGEAEANKLINGTLTPDILQREAINRWDGKLPAILEKGDINFLNLSSLIPQK